MKGKPLRRALDRLRTLLPELDRRWRRTRDVVVVSYPKSGRTWLRFMLDKAGIKLLYAHAGAENRKALTFPEISDEPAKWAGWQVVFMLRDPRDTVVSCYFQATKRLKPEYRFNGSLADFLRDPRYGIEKIARFNLLWLESAESFKAFALVSYERLHRDGPAALAQVVRFATGREPRRRQVEAAWLAGDFERMRKIEASIGPRISEKLRLGGGQTGDPDSLKTRRGKVGGWIDYFDAADVEFVEETLGRLDYWARTEALQWEDASRCGSDRSEMA